MSATIRKIRRLFQSSPRELIVRGRQAIYAQKTECLARLGRDCYPLGGHLRSLELPSHELPSWLVSRSRSLLTEEYAQRVRQSFEKAHDQRALLVQRADDIVAQKMYVLGHGMIDYSASNRWQTDPISGIQSPRKPYNRIRYLEASEVGDSKNVWEPNRFGWSFWLGATYVITGDQRYAKCFHQLTRDWVEQNPYPWGINYCSALEVAFRVYAWLWCLDLFRSYLSQHVELLDDLLQAIWIGCQHIESNLSEYFSPNTHLTGEAFALFAAGATLPEMREANRWLSLGETILREQSTRQFHRDGTHRELSSCYHLYSADFYLQAHLIAKRSGLSVSSSIGHTARRLSRRLSDLVRSDLSLPPFNDCDSGRLTWFGMRPLDASPTLDAASKEFDDLPRHVADHLLGYHVWLTNGKDPIDSARDSQAESDRETTGKCSIPVTVKSLDSGIASYHNEFGDLVIFRAGPFGYLDCGHSHDAPLSLILDLGGLPVIVDSGTGAYTSSHEIRDRFRSARGKNTMLVNGNGPSIASDWFSWKQKTDAHLTVAAKTEYGFAFQGAHSGFSAKLGFPVSVTRDIVILDVGAVVIADQWNAIRPIRCSMALTLHPHLKKNNQRSLSVETDDHTIHYDLISSNVKPAFRWDRGPYSPEYGQISETDVLVWDHPSAKSGWVITLLSRIGELKTTTARAGCAFQVGSHRFSVQTSSVPDTPISVSPVNSPVGAVAEST